MNEKDEPASPRPPCDVFSGQCPSRRLLDIIADKWTLLVVHCLHDGPRRNGELLRAIDGVSQKMLTQTLRELERNGFVQRTDHQKIPPRVDYALTSLGQSLCGPVRALDEWVERHLPEVEAAQRKFARDQEER